MIKVSVICCTYNRENFIVNTINQLKKQTLSDIEFIVVDDGSTDKSQKILEQQTNKDKRFVLLRNNTNKGPSAARNIALDKARGEYIGFFDVDDAIPLNYFEQMYNEATSKNADIVYTSYNNTKHRIYQHELYSLTEKISSLKNGAVWDKLFKSSKIKHLRFKEGYLCADNLFLIDAISHTQKMYLLDKPTYSYNLQPDSVSIGSEYQKQRKQQILEICKVILDHSVKYNYSNRETEELKAFLFRTFNSYSKDKKWAKSFYLLIGKEQYKQKATKRLSMRLFTLKLLRFCHLISKQNYNKKRSIILVSQSKMFDKKWYLSQNPDVKSQKMDAAKHYVKYGWKEGRNPSPQFDGNTYLLNNPDVKQSGINPLVHYILNGAKEGRTFVGINTPSSNSGLQHMHISLSQKIKDILTYPERIKTEYDRLNEELKTLERK